MAMPLMFLVAIHTLVARRLYTIGMITAVQAGLIVMILLLRAFIIPMHPRVLRRVSVVQQGMY